MLSHFDLFTPYIVSQASLLLVGLLEPSLLLVVGIVDGWLHLLGSCPPLLLRVSPVVCRVLGTDQFQVQLIMSLDNNLWVTTSGALECILHIM
jgi:hypothetical protein